jgi:hypothetical protein
MPAELPAVIPGVECPGIYAYVVSLRQPVAVQKPRHKSRPLRLGSGLV